MCRLFGFRSVIQSQVHRSLVRADNALCAKSMQHPDGWGVAYYVEGVPHVMRSAATAMNDSIFHKVSGLVSSETVVAHIRKATVGAPSILNSHPFQHGRWVFAHNGEIPAFERCKKEIVQEIAPQLRRFILGDTDSEAIFFLFLSELSRYGPLSGRLGIEETAEALRETVLRVRAIADGSGAPSPASLTFVITNGSTLIALQGGKDLYWSSYKTRCADRDVCPSFAPECEAATASGFVNHLILSSEPLSGENVWIPLERDEVIGVDWRMKIARRPLFGTVPPL